MGLNKRLIDQAGGGGGDDGKYIVAVQNGASLKYSDDYGATFTNKTGVIYSTAVGISGDGQYIMYGQSSGVLKLSANGGSFNTVSGSPVKAWNNIVISATGQYMLASSTGGIYYSTNYGSSFSVLSFSDFRSANMGTDGLYQIAGRASNSLWKTSDAWTNQDIYSGLPSATWGSAAVSDNGQYVIASNWTSWNTIFSTNSGSSFSTINSGTPSAVGISADGQYVTYAKNGGYIFVSSNYGSSFSQKHTSQAYDRCFVSATGQYQIASTQTNGSYIAVSQDYGATWTNAAYNGQGWDDIHISRVI